MNLPNFNSSRLNSDFGNRNFGTPQIHIKDEKDLSLFKKSLNFLNHKEIPGKL